MQAAGHVAQDSVELPNALAMLTMAAGSGSRIDDAYTPRDGNPWLIAKAFAQIADGNPHVLNTHATRIHYMMKAVIMASRR